MAPSPITDAERNRIRSLHAAGASRNDIAREVKRSGSTISKIVKELGLSFDRTATEAATAAKVSDAKARRAELTHRYLDETAKLLDQLWAPTVIHAFGGKDNTHNSELIDKPLFRDQRDIMQAASVATTASLRLDQHDSDTQGLAAVDAWLRDMVGGEGGG